MNNEADEQQTWVPQVPPPRRIGTWDSTKHGSGHVLTTSEEAEFTALVQRQSRFVFRVAYAVLLNPHDAEDAVQETFLKLYRNGGWQQLDNEMAFLARVAWRVAIDRRRSAHSVGSVADPDAAQDPSIAAIPAPNKHSSPPINTPSFMP